MFPSSLKFALTLAILPFVAAQSVSAQQLLLDQQPSQTFSISADFGFESVADNFVIPAPDDVSVIEFSIWGTWATAGLSTTDSFDIYFHQNTGGTIGDVPGALVANVLGLTPTVLATGNLMPTFVGMLPEYKLEFTLPSAVDLTPGTYWIELYSTGSSGSGEEFIWEMAPQDFINGAPCMAWSFETPGITWWPCTPFSETDMAIEIFGLSGPRLLITGLAGGSLATINVTNATPNGNVLIGYSLHGAGPTTTPYGLVEMTMPITRLPAITADAAGIASMSANVPVGASGFTLYSQAVDLTSGELTNPLAQPIL
jgi:hypothetical protein